MKTFFYLNIMLIFIANFIYNVDIFNYMRKNMSRPYRAVDFRGLKVVAYDNKPMSINDSPMFVDGEYVDNNLNIYDSYVDRYGSSRVRCYTSCSKARSVAESFNDRHEENEREERIKQEQRRKAYEAAKAERKRKIKAFISKIRNIFKNKRAV